jgi:hypothetical protein
MYRPDLAVLQRTGVECSCVGAAVVDLEEVVVVVADMEAGTVEEGATARTVGEIGETHGPGHIDRCSTRCSRITMLETGSSWHTSCLRLVHSLAACAARRTLFI